MLALRSGLMDIAWSRKLSSPKIFVTSAPQLKTWYMLPEFVTSSGSSSELNIRSFLFERVRDIV